MNIADYKKIVLFEVVKIMVSVIVLKFKVLLLNAQSLKRHAADINRARQLIDNEVTELDFPVKVLVGQKW